MKTILISTSQFGTAIPNYFNYLGEEFKKNNFSIIFIFDGQIKNLPANQKNIKYHTYPSKRPTRFKDFIFLYKIIKQENPILCISNFSSTNLVTLTSFILKIPHRLNYIHTSPYQINIDSKYNFLTKYLLKIRKILILKMNTHFFTNSNQMSELISNFFKIKKNKISVLPYLIKETKTDYKNYNNRNFSICIVGRLAPSKGHQELLLAFQNSLKKHPKLKLIIVGEGFEKNNLLKLSEKLKIKNNIIFFDNIPNENINKIFSKSLISISASKSEAFGIVNIESLRNGTPIICTKTEGAKDIIKNGQNGLFVDLNKKNDLCEKINIILNDWSHFSKNSLKIFENQYSKKNIKRHLQKFQILIDS